MPRTLMLAVEIQAGTDTLYFSSHAFTSRSTDTPSLQLFSPRLIGEVTFDRSVGCVVWGSRSRGDQNFGVIRLANADGELDQFAGSSLRDSSVVIKRGWSGSAYSTFSVVATLLVDRVEMSDEAVMSVFVTDITAKLERSLQTELYPDTVTNKPVRKQPRPITFGRCYQVPYVQPNAFGNGYYDVHDSPHWIGPEQVFDAGATLVEGSGYQRSRQGYGIERTSAVQGKQCATVHGAFKIDSTEISEDFGNLSAWTETNGGIAGRDATVPGGNLRMLNTTGGADLILAWTGSTPTGTDATYWFYSFECTTWVSGYCQFRTETTAVQRVIDQAGRYTGVIRASGNVVPSFVAPNGSNCDLKIGEFRIYKVSPLNGLEEFITFMTTDDVTVEGRGPLTTAELDLTAIQALEADAPYSLCFHASSPVQIADVLDQCMASFAGWWFVDRLGLLTVGRLLEPSGTPVLSFDSSNIADGMRVTLDEAKGLSNRMLGKRNWSPYQESEVVTSLQFVQMNSGDLNASTIVIHGDAYGFTALGTGSIRSMPLMFGDRYYFEVTPLAVASSAHYVGVGNRLAAVTSAPGATADSIAYRSNGNSVINGTSAAYGATYTAADVIQVAIDGRPAAAGSRTRGHRVWFGKNGTWQNAGDPDAEVNFLSSAINATGISMAMLGAGATGNSALVNLGQDEFVHTPPADYLAPAWQRDTITADFRDTVQSAVPLADAYRFADASESPLVTATADPIASRAYLGGIPTLLNVRADLQTEADRICTLYSQERSFYTFEAFIEPTDADELAPGDLIDVTYPRFGLSAKQLRVVGVRGELLSSKVEITAWG